MALDWIDLAPYTGGITGNPQIRKENNGLVRLRGTVTLTAAGPQRLLIPLGYEPTIEPIYMDWTGSPADGNLICAGNLLVVGNFNLSGFQLDLSSVVWLSTPLPEPDHTLANVQAGLADALRTIVGLRVYDFPSDRIEPPAAVLSLPETPYDVTLDGRSDEWTFPLWVLVAKANDKSAYGEMVEYLEAEGAKSIRAAIEADRTLGGACDTAAIVRARPLFATVAGTEFLAVEFTLEVYT